MDSSLRLGSKRDLLNDGDAATRQAEDGTSGLASLARTPTVRGHRRGGHFDDGERLLFNTR